MKQAWLLLFLILTLAACKTARINALTATRQDMSVTTEKLSGLNGCFSNKTSTGMVAEYYSLWSRLFPRQPAGQDWERTHVKLQVTDSATLLATLVRGDCMLTTNAIPFDVHNGYLRLKQRNYGEQLVGPLVWCWRKPDTYLGLSPSNNLVLVNGDRALMMLLIIPLLGGGDPYAMEYTRF